MRMLVIDDEEAILFALREYFTPMGYEVQCARGVEDAEALLEADGYAVMLLDLRLSGIGGSEGLHIARRVRERDPAMRVVILTAYSSPEAEAEAHRVGVDAFLHKPQPLRELSAIVRRLTVSGR
jgi:DNA-binding response OmpR family regulator